MPAEAQNDLPTIGRPSSLGMRRVQQIQESLDIEVSRMADTEHGLVGSDLLTIRGGCI
jgi:hypothetical protein